MNEKKPIKILKPYKVVRQKNENIEDAMELMTFISDTCKGIDSNPIRIISNRIVNPRNFMDNPRKILDQMIQEQINLGIGENCRGRRLYSLIYELPKKEYNVSLAEVEKFGNELIQKYPDFQAVGIVKESEESCRLAIAFNNYSENGMRMTKAYKTYYMSNIYNNYVRNQGKDKKDGDC